eukprot:m.180059 g.180059  ORF g.180059 m.180059 type:complete len:393 (+) comp15490_c0_seq3:64-1242(+)
MLFAFVSLVACSHATTNRNQNNLPEFSWDHISTWCFPCFAALPLTDEQVAWFNKFDMVDQCCSGLQLYPNGSYVPNVIETSFNVSQQLKAAKASTFFSPYIGMELGQSWYEPQQQFNTDPQHSHQWLRFANGTAVTCSPDQPYVCGLLQRAQNFSKVYDWRADGMIDYFVNNITGPFFRSNSVDGVFFDDIYTICEFVSGGAKLGWFNKDDGITFCAAAIQALQATADAGRAAGKLPIFSLKGDESNESAYNSTKYSQVLEQHGGMAYFEYWAGWPGQPRNENQLNLAIQLGQAGVPMQMHSTPDICRKNFTDWPLAMFLIAANNHSYFSVGEGWNAGLTQSLWLDAYDKPLGAPKGPATKTADHVWVRDFEHVTVYLDMGDCNKTSITFHS